MARFLVDAQLPPDLVLALRTEGHVADHVSRLGLGSATDRAIWDHACRVKAILITKDADFLPWAQTEAFGVPVLWVRLGNVRNAGLSQAIRASLPDLLSAVAAGERIVEIR